MLKITKTGHYLPKSNLYCNPEIRTIDKFYRNTCKYGHGKGTKYVKTRHSLTAKNFKLMKRASTE